MFPMQVLDHEGKKQENEVLGYFQPYQHAKSLIISK